MNAPTPGPGRRGNRLLGWEPPIPGARTVVPGPWGATPGAPSGLTTTPAFNVFEETTPKSSAAPPRSTFAPPPRPWPEGPVRDVPEAAEPPARTPTPRRHAVGYPLAVVAGIAVGLVVGGVTSSDGTPTPVVSGAPATQAPARPLPGGKVASGALAVPRPDGVHGFGETVTFADGSTLTVGPPVPFTPHDVAFGGETFARHARFKVTFTNNSGRPFDPSLSAGSVSSGDAAGEPVYETSLEAPSSTVLP